MGGGGMNEIKVLKPRDQELDFCFLDTDLLYDPMSLSSDFGFWILDFGECKSLPGLAPRCGFKLCILFLRMQVFPSVSARCLPADCHCRVSREQWYLTSLRKQESNQSVINLIYGNNTTGIKHPTVTAIDPFSWSQGSSCCTWYAGLQIVLLYHWNVMLAKHWEQLKGCKLTGRDRGVFFISFRGREKNAWLGWQIFPGGAGWSFSPPNSFSFLSLSLMLYFYGSV